MTRGRGAARPLDSRTACASAAVSFTLHASQRSSPALALTPPRSWLLARLGVRSLTARFPGDPQLIPECSVPVGLNALRTWGSGLRRPESVDPPVAFSCWRRCRAVRGGLGWEVHCNNNTEGSMMTSESAHSATPGDWIEARGLPGRSARRGQIVEVLGHGRREHYRVRWDERHEVARVSGGRRDRRRPACPDQSQEAMKCSATLS